MRVVLAACLVVMATVAVAENISVCGSSFSVTIMPQSPLVCLSVSGTPPTQSDPLPLLF